MQDGQSDLIRTVRSKFISLPEEKLILVQRRHPWVFILPVAAALIFGIISSIASLLILPFVLLYLHLFIPVVFLLFIFISSVTIKTVVNWYFNLYIVTNRKIIEVTFKPLSSREIDEVLLDQVKCTEIDARTGGIINELLDMGDVTITFDRPTHHEEFLFSNVQNPKRVETYLENALIADNPSYHEDGNGDRDLFNRARTDPKKWRYIEKIVRPRRGGNIAWNM